MSTQTKHPHVVAKHPVVSKPRAHKAKGTGKSSDPIADLMAQLGLDPNSDPAPGDAPTGEASTKGSRPSYDMIRQVAQQFIDISREHGAKDGVDKKPVFNGKDQPTAEHILEFGKFIVAVDKQQSLEAFDPIGQWLISKGTEAGATGKDRNAIYNEGKPLSGKNMTPQAAYEMGEWLLSLVPADSGDSSNSSEVMDDLDDSDDNDLDDSDE